MSTARRGAAKLALFVMLVLGWALWVSEYLYIYIYIQRAVRPVCLHALVDEPGLVSKGTVPAMGADIRRLYSLHEATSICSL